MPVWRIAIQKRSILLLIYKLFLCFVLNITLTCSVIGKSETLASQVETLDSGSFSIEYPSGMEKYAKVVAGASQLALRNLNSATQDPLLVHIRIVVVPNASEFHSLVSADAENSIAVSVSGKQLLIINLPQLLATGDSNLPAVLTHELMHVYLDIRCTGPVPIWLHEGLAQLVAPPLEKQSNALLSWYAFNGTQLSFNRINDKFPAQPSDRELAYSQSLSFVSFIIRGYYGGSLPLFLKKISGESGKFKLQQFSSPGYVSILENAWVKSLTSPGNWLEIMLSDGIFWFIAILILVVAWWKMRQRKKAFHEQWDREDSGEAVWSSENEEEFAPTWDPCDVGETDIVKCDTSDWEPENDDEERRSY